MAILQDTFLNLIKKFHMFLMTRTEERSYVQRNLLGEPINVHNFLKKNNFIFCSKKFRFKSLNSTADF